MATALPGTLHLLLAHCACACQTSMRRHGARCEHGAGCATACALHSECRTPRAWRRGGGGGYAMPELVMTTALRGLPHLLFARAALSSPRNDASLLYVCVGHDSLLRNSCRWQ